MAVDEPCNKIMIPNVERNQRKIAAETQKLYVCVWGGEGVNIQITHIQWQEKVYEPNM